jgi:hypothetical protein
MSYLSYFRTESVVSNSKSVVTGVKKYDKIHEKYDAVVPQRSKWVKMSRKRYEIGQGVSYVNDC